MIIRDSVTIATLQTKLTIATEALKFYADGHSDLEPIESKKHLYAENFPMGSPEWRKRSMSDYITGKVARATLAKIERE